MSTLTLKPIKLKQPSSLIFLYLTSLSFTFLFVDTAGQSTLIDEFMLLAMLPISAAGIFKHFFSIGRPAKLLVIYFFAVALSSAVTLGSRNDIPWIAPALGIILDTKFLVFLGALLYLTNCSKYSADQIILSICRAILLVGTVHSIFFLRDILSNGMSISGIALTPSDIFGYIPIGLFSHKLYTAIISSISFASAITLYLSKRRFIFILLSGFFLVILFLSSSLKELGVAAPVLLLFLRSLRTRGDRTSGAIRKLLFLTVISTPILAFIFGSALVQLVSSRASTYLFEANTRAALHIKSAEIATDHFPLGSGAGTFSSQPSRSIYYSPLYYEYGMHEHYGASEEYSSFLMDAGWPKFISEAGWLGGSAYFLAYLIAIAKLAISFFRGTNPANIFGLMLGSLIFFSAIGSAVFTGDMGLMVCALMFTCLHLNRKQRTSRPIPIVAPHSERIPRNCVSIRKPMN